VQVVPGRADALAAGLRRALALFRDPQAWRVIQANGMATDVSWGPSAARYAALLRGLAARHG
jgi:starch synthase